MVRYAAARVIICRTHPQAERAVHAVRRLLQKLTLPRHPPKTRLVGRAQEGFDFRGFHCHKLRAKRPGKLLPDRWPSPQAMQALRRDLHELTRRQRLAEGLAAIIPQLKLVITGWRHYVPIGNSSTKRQQLDRYVGSRVRQLVRAKRGSRGHWTEHVFAAWWQGRGLVAF